MLILEDNMKKTVALFTIVILICGGMGAAAITNERAPGQGNRMTLAIKIDFASHIFHETDDLYLQPLLHQ